MKTSTQNTTSNLIIFMNKHAKILIALFVLVLLSSCSDDSNTNDDDNTDDDETVDNDVISPLEDMGEPQVVASGLLSAEGPVWHASTETLFFSDIPASIIYSLDVNTLELTTFRSPSNASNGLAFDNEGYLLAAEQETRLISRMDITTNEVENYIETVNIDGEDLLFKKIQTDNLNYWFGAKILLKSKVK